MNDLILYLDSKDSLSAGLENSSDYAYCVLFRMPSSSINEMLNTKENEESISESLTRLLKEKDSVYIILTDVLYYRFLLSLASLFAFHDQQEMGLLIKSSELIFDSMTRNDISILLDSPEISSVDNILETIQKTAIAQDEELSISIKSRIREIRNSLFGDESEEVLHSFSKNASDVLSFSLLTRRSEIAKFVSDTRELLICNPSSNILSIVRESEIRECDLSLFKTINDFCTAICTVFSTLFVDREEDQELDDVYKSIWSFIIKTKSSCFLPQEAYEKARTLLLSTV